VAFLRLEIKLALNLKDKADLKWNGLHVVKIIKKLRRSNK